MTEIYKLVYPSGKEEIIKLVAEDGIILDSLEDLIMKITGMGSISLSEAGYKLYFLGLE